MRLVGFRLHLATELRAPAVGRTLCAGLLGQRGFGTRKQGASIMMRLAKVNRAVIVTPQKGPPQRLNLTPII
jgi:hypothetical protein